MDVTYTDECDSSRGSASSVALAYAYRIPYRIGKKLTALCVVLRAGELPAKTGKASERCSVGKREHRHQDPR